MDKNKWLEIINLWPGKVIMVNNSATADVSSAMAKGLLAAFEDIKTKYGEEIVEKAIMANFSLWSYFGTEFPISNWLLERMCESLKDEKEDVWASTFDASMSLSEGIMNDKKIHMEWISWASNYYSILHKYVKPWAKCVDISFEKKDILDAKWDVAVWSLLDVNNALSIALHRENNNPHATRAVVPDYIEGESFIDKAQQRARFANPIISESLVKMDPLNALLALPEDSVDVLMLNNVDAKALSPRQQYDLRRQIKYVVKENGLVFWYCTEIRPEWENYIIQENKWNPAFDNIWLTAFKNPKAL